MFKRKAFTSAGNKFSCFKINVCLQCAKTFLNLMAHISKEQTVQYILTLIDDTLQVLCVSTHTNSHKLTHTQIRTHISMHNKHEYYNRCLLFSFGGVCSFQRACCSCSYPYSPLRGRSTMYTIMLIQVKSFC